MLQLLLLRSNTIVVYQIRIVHANKSNAAILFHIVQDFPIESIVKEVLVLRRDQTCERDTLERAIDHLPDTTKSPPDYRIHLSTLGFHWFRCTLPNP